MKTVFQVLSKNAPKAKLKGYPRHIPRCKFPSCKRAANLLGFGSREKCQGWEA
jgi:hypothetical protein